ncbi:YhfG family protein [Photobacterium obscurum]|uniref:YhfG family protein n=1 Tax=Photobacterium obscurum TaxID=2829490 RepID=UPI00389AB86F
MLTIEQKRGRFKALQARNYRASLQLEGFDVEPSKRNVEAETSTESEIIAKLKRQYAR